MVMLPNIDVDGWRNDNSVQLENKIFELLFCTNRIKTEIGNL